MTTLIPPTDPPEETGAKMIIPARQPTRARTWTGDVEWYTPAYIVEAAAEVMGDIDLDPATSDAQQARATVKANRYFTVMDDGLDQHWRGRVFLNPPYAHGWIDRFVAKLLLAYGAGEVSQAVLLTNSSTETRWWQQAANSCAAVCFLKGRVRFLKVGADGALTPGKKSPSHPHSIFYFGPDPARFAQVFSRLGLLFFPTNKETSK